MTTHDLSRALAGAIFGAGLLASVAAVAQQADGAVPGAVPAAGRTLAQAVGIAEEAAGGRAYEAEVEEEDGRLVHKVSTLAGDAPAETVVDAGTGEVLSSEGRGVIAGLLRDDAEEIAAMAGARIGLTEAIAAAEGAAGGRAVEAEIEDEDGAQRFAVRVLGAGGEVSLVAVDAASGEVLATGPASGDD